MENDVSVLAFVLAGGKGSRLYPLTKNRAKPAVPFGGRYRIVDFVLSNLVNSGISSVYVLTQFKSQSLLQHLRDGWQFSDLLKNQFIIPVPAQMHVGETWYQGTADAIYQNLHLVENANPDLVVVFGADHIYRMDVRPMLRFHRENNAMATVAALPVPVDQAIEFGTMEVNEHWRILAFHEKVPDPPQIPGRPGWTLASMGNYIFDVSTLVTRLAADAEDPNSAHDFGRNLLPQMVQQQAPVFAYDFLTNDIPGDTEQNRGYWRDVGTIEAYYEANMDLRSALPALNIYNQQWPLRTASYPLGAAKFSPDGEGRHGYATDSIISTGCIIVGAKVVNSVFGRSVFVDSGAEIEDSIVLANCRIGAGARIRRAILDRNVELSPGEEIGFDAERDRSLYHVSESGIVVVAGRRSPVPIVRISI